MSSERDQEVLRVTFGSTDPRDINAKCGWGWRIPFNPERAPDENRTELELEVRRLAQEGTPQLREEWRTKTYAYWAPFNYPNVTVDLGRPGTGVEFNPDGAELDIYPYGAITIAEEEPIVAVTVIGSGCSVQAYVIIEAEPLEWKFARTAVRMRRDDLWGMHVRGRSFNAGIKEDWNDAGLSCAHFDIPASRRVIVGGGSLGGDPHYCIRLIRLDVKG
jgi:hypothetical protein